MYVRAMFINVQHEQIVQVHVFDNSIVLQRNKK